LPKERVERDEEDLVRLYLTDIGQYPLLTKDDEVRLAQAIEVGNAARAELEAAGRKLPPARKRELRRSARDGEAVFLNARGGRLSRQSCWKIVRTAGERPDSLSEIWRASWRSRCER
jgi:site-specific recombinase XerD